MAEWLFETRAGRWTHRKIVQRWWSWQNWRKGYKFGPIQRCRECDHTTPYHYPSCRLRKAAER